MTYIYIFDIYTFHAANEILIVVVFVVILIRFANSYEQMQKI